MSLKDIVSNRCSPHQTDPGKRRPSASTHEQRTARVIRLTVTSWGMRFVPTGIVTWSGGIGNRKVSWRESSMTTSTIPRNRRILRRSRASAPRFDRCLNNFLLVGSPRYPTKRHSEFCLNAGVLNGLLRQREFAEASVIGSCVHPFGSLPEANQVASSVNSNHACGRWFRARSTRGISS